MPVRQVPPAPPDHKVPQDQLDPKVRPAQQARQDRKAFKDPLARPERPDHKAPPDPKDPPARQAQRDRQVPKARPVLRRSL